MLYAITQNIVTLYNITILRFDYIHARIRKKSGGESIFIFHSVFIETSYEGNPEI